MRIPRLRYVLIALQSLLGIGHWSDVRAQFSTTGFDTVIVEKKYRNEFIYWIGRPYDSQTRIVWQGFESKPLVKDKKWQQCSWQILTGQGDGPWTIWFTIKIDKGYYRELGGGGHFEISPYQALPDPAFYVRVPVFIPESPDPASSVQAPVFVPSTPYMSSYVQSRLRLEKESSVMVHSAQGDTFVARLYTRPAFIQPFKSMIRQAKHSAAGDLPVLDQASYDPTLRDAGLVFNIGEQQYALLCSGPQRRAWIFRNNQLVVMFQYDLDHLPSVSAPVYEFRIEPFMFVRPGLSQADQKRLPLLLMMARATAELVKDNRFF